MAVEDSRKGAAAAVAAGLQTWVLGESGDADDLPAVAGFVEWLDRLVEVTIGA